MKRSRQLLLGAALGVGLAALGAGVAWADGRPGTVEWSDGHKQTGAISLTPGNDLRLFTNGAQVSLQLDEVKEIHFKPEKEEMWEGFYFPNAGQATQVKTGEVYPIRYLQTQITLGNGQVVEGHLFTTVFYVENDDGTQKVVVMAKQTGANGQKLADLSYPTDIHFDADASSAGSSQIDLTQAGFMDAHQIVVVAKPDLGLLPVTQMEGKPVWTVPLGNPGLLLFAVEATDGIHVAWPPDAWSAGVVDPGVEDVADRIEPLKPVIERRQAVQTALQEMQDFYDTRGLLGCFGEADDVYSLVMMKRLGKSVDGNGTPLPSDIIPWSLVILHWKYDPEQKKVTLLNRTPLATRQLGGNSPPPAVFKEPGLLRDISALPAPAPEGNQP
ncbi:MAG: hypothetical protein LV481_11670 [Methylacidiphilales bacterium]|nr:hypothetical protein [Candidatus Methylacidiphilales bacterium]